MLAKEIAERRLSSIFSKYNADHDLHGSEAPPIPWYIEQLASVIVELAECVDVLEAKIKRNEDANTPKE